MDRSDKTGFMPLRRAALRSHTATMMRRLPLVVVALVGLVLTGCTSAPGYRSANLASAVTAALTSATLPTNGSGASTVSGGSAAALRRPLQLPTVSKGQPCPVTLAQHQPDPALGLVQGNGPAGPVGLSKAGVLQYVSPAEGTAFSDKSWGGQKVLWAANSAVDGPVLVRGGQLDGAHGVRFNDPAVAEMLLPPKPPITAGGWRDYPSFTRLQAPGCYAYQVDTPTGTTVIIFRAEGPNL